MNKGLIHAYGLGLAAGMGVIIWLMTNLVTSKQFEDHLAEDQRKWRAHDSLRDETLVRLLGDIEKVRRSVERIEGILLQNRVDARNAMGSKTK